MRKFFVVLFVLCLIAGAFLGGTFFDISLKGRQVPASAPTETVVPISMPTLLVGTPDTTPEKNESPTPTTSVVAEIKKEEPKKEETKKAPVAEKKIEPYSNKQLKEDLIAADAKFQKSKKDRKANLAYATDHLVAFMKRAQYLWDFYEKGNRSLALKEELVFLSEQLKFWKDTLFVLQEWDKNLDEAESQMQELDEATRSMEKAMDKASEASSDLADLTSDILERRVKDLEK